MATWLMGLIAITQAADDKPEPPATKNIYSDKSWTHIGNGNFSPDSDAASDLTVKSAGESMSFAVNLDEKTLKEIGEARWNSVELQGEVIGNDTGYIGCSATVVKLNGEKIGQIEKSGQFRIVFEKSLLTKTPKKPIVILIESGNAAGDADDQELGQFLIRLSEARIPKPAEKKSADE
jgi:hypothetical protein